MICSGVSYLAESIEDLIEVDENLALCNFGDVVHALAGVVSNTRILIAKACEDWRHDFLEVPSYFLLHHQRNSALALIVRTGPRAMDAAASPMRPPFRA